MKNKHKLLCGFAMLFALAVAGCAAAPGQETPPASDESNNEQESAEDPSYNEILEIKIVDVFL